MRDAKHRTVVGGSSIEGTILSRRCMSSALGLVLWFTAHSRSRSVGH